MLQLIYLHSLKHLQLVCGLVCTDTTEFCKSIKTNAVFLSIAVIIIIFYFYDATASTGIVSIIHFNCFQFISFQKAEM